MLPKQIYPALCMAALSAGCTVGPEYVRPELSMPERYQSHAALAQRPAPVTAELANWWAGFGDPQLTRYVTLALAQNLDLAQAAARMAQARAGLGQADAALLPSGNVAAQGSRAYQSVETPLGQVLNARPGFDRHGSAYEADLSAAWEADVFGGLRRGREAALADYQASQAGVAATRLAVAAQTADIYIALRGLQARLEVAHQQVRTQRDMLANIELLHRKGLVSDVPLRQAEAALAQASAAVPPLEAGLDVAMNALDVMLGSQPGTHRAELAEGGAIPAAPGIGGADAPAELLRRRPDLIVAERRLAAANARVGVALAEYYPKFSLSGMVGSATAVAGGNLFSSPGNQAAGVLGLRWRLFDFGRIDAEIALARGQEAEQLSAYRQAVLRASEDVENALSALVKREQQLAAAAQGAEALARARAHAVAAYRAGTNSRIEVLQAEENWQRAADARVQAQTESARAAVASFKALGGGWQYREAASLTIAGD